MSNNPSLLWAVQASQSVSLCLKENFVWITDYSGHFKKSLTTQYYSPEYVINITTNNCGTHVEEKLQIHVILLEGNEISKVIRYYMMTNCFFFFFFFFLVDQRKAFSLISSWDHCQRSSPSGISNTQQAGFEPVQHLSSEFRPE